ncbi:hypothetical protein THAOC_20823, partial [Thalassiosira oceanica]
IAKANKTSPAFNDTHHGDDDDGDCDDDDVNNEHHGGSLVIGLTPSPSTSSSHPSHQKLMSESKPDDETGVYPSIRLTFEQKIG